MAGLWRRVGFRWRGQGFFWGGFFFWQSYGKSPVWRVTIARHGMHVDNIFLSLYIIFLHPHSMCLPILSLFLRSSALPVLWFTAGARPRFGWLAIQPDNWHSHRSTVGWSISTQLQLGPIFSSSSSPSPRHLPPPHSPPLPTSSSPPLHNPLHQAVKAQACNLFLIGPGHTYSPYRRLLSS